MDSKQNPTTELLNILSKAMDSGTYGSIEIYLEDGQITQITERRIRKMKKSKAVSKPATKTLPKTAKKTLRASSKDQDLRVKFQN